ncbi:unnamed protein product [Closterium sp. NIES-64]|nr:unnamed protein product [Closterium sp. NIES-64]
MSTHFAIPGTASSPHPPSVILARPSSPLHMPPPLSLPSSPPSAPPLPLLMSLPSPLLPHEGRVLAENDIMKALLMSPRPSSPHLSTPRSPHHPSPYPTPHSATPHSPISMDRGAMQRQVLTGMKKSREGLMRRCVAGWKDMGQAVWGRQADDSPFSPPAPPSHLNTPLHRHKTMRRCVLAGLKEAPPPPFPSPVRSVLAGLKEAPPPPFPSPVRSVLAGLKEVGRAVSNGRAKCVGRGRRAFQWKRGSTWERRAWGGGDDAKLCSQFAKHALPPMRSNHYLNHHIQPFRPHPFHPHPFHPHPFYPHPFHPHPFHPHPLPVPQVVAEREGASVRQGGG